MGNSADRIGEFCELAFPMKSFRKYYWITISIIVGLIIIHSILTTIWSVAIPGWSLVIDGRFIEMAFALLILIFSIPVYFLIKFFLKRNG